MDFNFKDRDIINGYDFTTQELCHIMDTAMIYEKRVKSGEAIKDMEGMLVATLFFEPSTRTRLSFNSAIQRMGASTIDLGSASASSQSKGETWQDTIRTVDGYVDAIVMRHPVAGSAIEAAEIAQHPLINGGPPAPHTGAAGYLYHAEGKGPHRRPDHHLPGRPEVWPHRTQLGLLHAAVRQPDDLRLTRGAENAQGDH